jgi:hypothetical protein
MKVVDTKAFKTIQSANFNSVFCKKTGEFFRWGATKNDDPDFCPFGNEILDIEISTICYGPQKENNKCSPCLACYKNLTSKGENMSFETYKTILSKMPPVLQQVAIGIGSVANPYTGELVNPDLFNIMNYTREKGIVPNITINGSRMDDEHYRKLATLCGAVSVSFYDKDSCYDTVEKLNLMKSLPEATLKQVNIHQILSLDTLPQCYEVLKDSKKDSRLKDLNAIVFLILKPKGKRNTLTQLKNKKEYKKLIDTAFANHVRIGFDSCGCAAFLDAVKDYPNYKIMETYSESCESTLFSAYINVDGMFFPCSFTENTPEWEKGLNVINCSDFTQDIWNHPKTIEFRNKLLSTPNCDNNYCRTCPIYDLSME